MSTFEVPIRRVRIKNHPNADRLAIAEIQGTEYQSLVGIGEYETGDLVVYIPEDSIVPEWIQEKLGVKGKLAGSDKNRIRSVRLRGVYSQGLCFPVEHMTGDSEFEGGHYIFRDSKALDGRLDEINENYSVDPLYKRVEVGDDVQDFLGIEKYEPPVPVHMSGEVFNARGNTLKYDIENFRKYPDVLEEGEEVVVMEKLHGTFCCIGVVPKGEASTSAGRHIISSKGLSSKGLALKLNEKNKDNVYVRAARKYNLLEKLSEKEDGYYYILGEVFGRKIQDLEYGAEKDELFFRVFDIYKGSPKRGSTGGYLDDNELEEEIDRFGLKRVPVFYRGSYSKNKISNFVSGRETVTGEENHMREGVVVRPTEERHVEENLPMGGRVQLKWKSEEYKLRNEETATERR